MLKGNELPAFPNNDRIIVRPDVPPEQIGTLWVPDVAKVRANMGTIVHAGLKARDQLYDNGHELGDHVWWGKFAGVIEEWSHISKDGKGKCDHLDADSRDGTTWNNCPSPGDRMELRECSRCGARWLKEPILVMNVEDILCNESLEARHRDGLIEVIRGKDADGKTTHFIRRKADLKETQHAA